MAKIVVYGTISMSGSVTRPRFAKRISLLGASNLWRAWKGVVAQTCDTTGFPGGLLFPDPPDIFGA
jgi:hypothetical protein